MDSQDHINTPHSPGGKSHVCTKCGWNYPNPHPSAKNRRSHKKLCGTIKGFEILDSEMAEQNLDLQKEPCLDDEQNLPSLPRVVEKADERIGDTSEDDVFADAASEFSRSDSFKGKEETATNFMAKKPGEAQPCTKNPEMVQESCEVPPVDFPKTVEAASEQGGEPFVEGHSMAFVTLNDSAQEAQVVEVVDTISNVGLETDCKVDLPDESESKLASALGKRKDNFGSSWNDEVIYSDLEGPDGFGFEEMSMMHPSEAEYTVTDDNVPVSTSTVGTNADQVISTRQSARGDIPFTDNADVSLDGTKHEEVSVNPFLPETPKGEECETDGRSKAGIQPEGICIGTEVSSPDKFLVEPQGQTAVEIPSGDNLVISKVGPEDNIMKAEEGESSFGACQETVESEILKASLPEVVPIVADSNADVSHSDLTGHESELIQASVVAEDNSPNSKLSCESSCAVQHYVSVVLEGDDQKKSSPETSINSILERKNEARKEELVEESSFIKVANAKDEESNFATDGSAQTAKLVESKRIELNRVVGGLGVIQANEIDSDVLKAHNLYAEVPVTIESNDHRDFGRLQNLSEAHIRSLVSSPLVTRYNTSNAFESTSGVSDGVEKPENGSQSSSLAVALSKNQEITMEKTTSWSTAKEQHFPLENLLSEARSPRLVAAEAKKDHESSLPRVSSILLDQETSPEEGGRWPERREVSEEWNSPAKYQVELKREERKVKGRRPFWVPFVCCSSVK